MTNEKPSNTENQGFSQPVLTNNPQLSLWIEPATIDDIPAIIQLFDEAIFWLVAHGLEAQWGCIPFSQLPGMTEYFQTFIERREQYIVYDHSKDQIVGTLALCHQPPAYIAQEWQTFPESAWYLESFTTTRTRTGQGIGRSMLQWVKNYALQSGKSTLFLDCWADNLDLCTYYQKSGFQAQHIFFVKDWRGQLFKLAL